MILALNVSEQESSIMEKIASMPLAVRALSVLRLVEWCL